MKWLSNRYLRRVYKSPYFSPGILNASNLRIFRLANISFCALIGSTVFDIGYVFTNAKFRNRQNAYFLIKKILRVCKGEVFAQVASVNLASLALFKKLGFKLSRVLYGYHGPFPTYELVKNER